MTRKKSIDRQTDGLAHIESDSGSKMIGIMNNKPISTLLTNAQVHIYDFGKPFKDCKGPNGFTEPNSLRSPDLERNEQFVCFYVFFYQFRFYL